MSHPEIRTIDRDGAVISRLSYAYPETQKFIADQLSQMAEYDCDGIDLIFNRGFPFTLFEQPVIDRIEKKFGIDAKQLNQNDERLIGVRCDIMSEFLEYVCSRLQCERRNRKQKPLKIAVHVFKNIKASRFAGLDIKNWVKNKLVNDIICYPMEQFELLPDSVYTDSKKERIDVEKYSELMNRAPCNFTWSIGTYEGANWDVNEKDGRKIKELVELVENTEIDLYIELMPRITLLSERVRQVKFLLENGITQFSMWDTQSRANRLRQWSLSSRLGSMKNISTSDISKLYKNHRILIIGDHRIDRFPPHWGT